MLGHKKENNHWIYNNILLDTNTKANVSQIVISYIEEKWPLKPPDENHAVWEIK